MFDIVFYHPEIPANTGNAIRLAAGARCRIHLVEPLGFDLDDARLRRAGLDYHDLATLHTHPDLASAWTTLRPERVFALTKHAERCYTDVSYRRGDAFLFGPESIGLPADVLDSETVTENLRIPLAPGVRSLNLANSTAITVYEAWRQQDFALD